MGALCLALNLVIPSSLADAPPDSVPKGFEWPIYQGGPGFSGVSPDSSIKPPFKLAWSYRLDGDATGDAGGGVTVGGGLVYVNVLDTRSLLALDADTGRLRWTYDASYLGYRTVPSYANGRLFLWERGLAKKPRVLALEAANGKVLWDYPLRPDNLTNVRVGLPVVDGKVFCAEGGEEPTVTSLDEKTGKPVWRVGLGKDGGNEINQPSVAGGTVFVATRAALRGKPEGNGTVIALSATSGKEKWRRACLPSDRPLFTDGMVLACSQSDRKGKYQFSLLDAANGTTLWTFANFASYNPLGVTIGKDVILIKPYGGSFFIADRKTGKQLARFNGITNSGCGTTILAGDHAFVGTGVLSGDLEAINAFKLVDAPREAGRYGSLHAVDVLTGKSSWFCGTGNTVCGDPAIAYGRLYFTSRDGRVYCFAPAKPGEALKPEAVDRSEPADPDRVKALLTKKPTKPFPAGKAWPMFGGNPSRSGLSLSALKLPLQPAWKIRLGDRVCCGAAIASGKVVIGSDAGNLVALEADGGKKLWEFATGAPIRCSPAVAGDLVYCGSDSGKFHALDLNSGKEKWSFHCGGPVQASPAIVGDVVLFGANDHNIYALDRLTGAKLWSFRMRDFLIQAPPVVHGGQVFVGQWHDWVYALDLLTGKEQWRTFIPISIEALASHRDKLYARTPNYLIEIDPRTGKRLRLGTALPYSYGGLAFMGDRVFQSGVSSQYGSPGREVVDLSQPGTPPRTKVATLEDVLLLQATGMKGAPGLAAMTPPLVLGDTICFAALKGKVLIVEPDGKQLWSAPLGGACHSPPVAAAGLLVVGCDDGYVFAFREP